MFSPEQLAVRSGSSKTDKAVRLWLASLPDAEKTEFLKQLWPLNYRYALALAQGAQLPRSESEALLRHWLTTGSHNAAQELIERFQPMLGERRFWGIVAQEPLTDEMRAFLDYHGQRRHS